MAITSSNHQHSALPVRQFDLSIPLKRFNGQVSPDTEDTDLTEFVQAHLAKAFSLSEGPPACAHCGDRHTRLRAQAISTAWQGASAGLPVPGLQAPVQSSDRHATGQYKQA
jgi:hypothetical protein